MAEFKQIEQAYQRLFEAFKSTKKMPANEQLQEFANLLPADAESRKKVLGDIIKAGDRRFYRSFTTALEDFAKNTAENQTDNPPKKDENTVSSPKKTQNSGKKDPQSTGKNDTTKPKKKDSPETTLTDDERMQKLAALQQVYAEALNAPETIRNQQQKLKNVRHNRVFADKPLNKTEKNYAEQIRSLVVETGANLDGISAEEILLTCRKAVEEKALQTFKESYKSALTPEKVKEVEQQMRAFDLRQRIKNKISKEEIQKREIARDAFVEELRTAFAEKQGYALWGSNGNILKTLREAISEYKKENGLTRDKDDRKKDDTRGKKPEDKGDTKMAEKDELKKIYAEVQTYFAYEAIEKSAKETGVYQNEDEINFVGDDNNKKIHKETKAHLFEKMQTLFAADRDLLKEVATEKDTEDKGKYETNIDIRMAGGAQRIKELFEDHDETHGNLGLEPMTDAEKEKLKVLGFEPENDFTSPNDYKLWRAIIANGYKKDGTLLPLNTHENTPNPPAPPTNEQADWVKEKAQWYTKYNDEKHLTNFNITRADNQFEVKFEGGTITYESKENVSISAGASYKVYEALLREDHNKDRPVQFPANASEHLTSMLYAASILNETGEGKPHEMLGVEKEKIKMDLIEQQLRAAGYGDAEIKKVKDYYDTHEGKEADSDTRGAENMPTRPEVKQMAEDNNYTITKNDDGHVVIEGLNKENKPTFQMDYNPADGKYSYSTMETKETVTDIEDQDAVFLKGKAEGFLSIQSDLDLQIKLAKREAANGGTLLPQDGKELQESRMRLVEAYSKDPALFRRAMGGLINNTTVESQEHADLRKAQIAMLRAKAEKNGELQAHQDKETERQAARDRLLVLRGIKSNDDGKILGEDGKTPVKTDTALAKELSDNLKEYTAAKTKDKELTLDKFITDKYKDKGLNNDEMNAKITTQATYNLQVERYGKPQTTR